MSLATRVMWWAVGLVVLIVGGLGVRQAITPDGYELTAVFDDVGDLVNQHSVQIADVRVGQITGIELTDDFRARVTLTVEHGIDVPQGSEAILRTTSLLGEKFIEIRPPSSESMVSGPYLGPGDTIEQTSEAPELEFVADTAIEILSAIQASDVGALVDVGAAGFGGQREQLATIVGDLSTISGTLADRSQQIVRIIDNLDVAARSLGGGSDAIREALGHLAETTDVLVANRDRAVEALKQLSRLAKAQNTVVVEHFDAVNTQITQVDEILATLADSQGDLDSLLVWLEQFVITVPDLIPRDFTLVFMEGVLRGSSGD